MWMMRAGVITGAGQSTAIANAKTAIFTMVSIFGHGFLTPLSLDGGRDTMPVSGLLQPLPVVPHLGPTAGARCHVCTASPISHPFDLRDVVARHA